MYEEMTYEAIMDSMLSRMDKDIDKRAGSIAYDSTAAVAWHLAEMYFLLEHYLDLVFPDTAAGPYLDRFCSAFHVERKPAVRAVRAGKFDRELPPGSRFSTAGETPLVYRALESGKPEGEAVVCELECETPGKAGNEYFGDLIPIGYIDGLGLASLGEIIVPGADEETDDAMRERFFAKVRRPSASGNANDYYNWAMSCGGVGAVKVFPLADGPGTVKLVIASENKTAVEETLLKRVADDIEERKPIGASVRVASAEEKTINISAAVKLEAGSGLGEAQNEFLKQAAEYLRENAFGAAYISTARIGNLLINVKGIADYTDLKLNGESENVVLKEEEIAVIGTVRLET